MRIEYLKKGGTVVEEGTPVIDEDAQNYGYSCKPDGEGYFVIVRMRRFKL